MADQDSAQMAGLMVALQALRRSYAEEVQRDGQASPNTTFNYASVLADTHNKDNLKHAVALFGELLQREGRDRDVLFLIAKCHLELGNFREARQFAVCVLDMEPNNRQAQELVAKVDKGVNRDGAIGMAIVGGLAAVAAATGIALARHALRR